MAAIELCLREIKARHGWGMGEVARQIGVHPETLTKLRAGRVQFPRFDVVAELHRLAGQSLDDLVGIPRQAPNVDLHIEQRLSTVEAQLRGVLVMLGTAPVPVSEADVDEAVPREIREGIKKVERATAGKGRVAKDEALRKRTAEREKEGRNVRDRAS